MTHADTGSDTFPVETENTNVLQLSIAAGRWQLLNTISQQALVMGTFFVLARLLTPADFGTVALIALVPAFLDGITTFSFDTAALQKRENMTRYLNVIWTFNIIRAAVIFIAAALIAPYAAHFFRIEYALPALYLSGLVIFLQSLANIGQNYFFLTLEFRKIFYRDLVLKVSYAIAAVALAATLHSYWALFIGSIISFVCVVIATYAIHPYRPRLDFNFALLRELHGFSTWVYAQEVAKQVDTSIKDAILGRFTSPMQIGLFGKAKSLAAAPTAPIASTISKVSFSSYVLVQESPSHVAEGVAKTFDILIALALPYVALVLLTSNRIVEIVLGDAWLSITPLLKILILAVTLDVLSSQVAAPVFNGLGKPRIQFIIGGLYAAITLCGFLIIVPRFGAIGAAYVMLAGSLVAAATTAYFISREITLDSARVGWTLCTTAAASVVPSLAALRLLSLPFFNSTIGYLLLVGGAAVLYAAGIAAAGIVLWKGPYETFALLARPFFAHGR